MIYDMICVHLLLRAAHGASWEFTLEVGVIVSPSTNRRRDWVATTWRHFEDMTMEQGNMDNGERMHNDGRNTVVNQHHLQT